MAKIAQKSLVAKLAEACNAVGGVEKKGRNDFQKYNYVKAADVAKAIRHELFSRGVVVIPNEKEFVETAKIPTNSGGQMREFRLTVEYTIYDSESKETIVVFAFGVAMDSGDKAIYKCKTGAAKYFLRALGLIPDEKDDVEFDESVDEQTDPRVLASPEERKGRAKRKRIAEYKVRAFDSSCHATGKTADQVAKYLRVRWSAQTVQELTDDDFTVAIQWANGTEQLAETVATSVQAIKRAPQPVVDVYDQRRPDEVEAAGD